MHNEQCSSSLFILNCSFLIPHSSFFSFRRRLGRPSALARRLLRLLAGQPGRRLRHRRRLIRFTRRGRRSLGGRRGKRLQPLRLLLQPPLAGPHPRFDPLLPPLLLLPLLGVVPSPELRVLP